MKYELHETQGHRQFTFNSEDDKLPLNIRIVHHLNRMIEYVVDCGGNGFRGMVCTDGRYETAEPVSNGKLTGIQMRTIAAKDQLDTLLQDELFSEIKDLAESSLEELVDVLQGLDWELDSPTLKAISAMALFCYTEIVERGLKQPGKQE